MRKDTIVFVIVALFTVIAIPLAFYIEINFWNECREDNSFMYCLRLLSR